MLLHPTPHLWWSFDRRRAASPSKLGTARRPTLSLHALDGSRGDPFWWRNWCGRHRGLGRHRRRLQGWSGDLRFFRKNCLVYSDRMLERINCFKVGLHWPIHANGNHSYGRTHWRRLMFWHNFMWPSVQSPNKNRIYFISSCICTILCTTFFTYDRPKKKTY